MNKYKAVGIVFLVLGLIDLLSAVEVLNSGDMVLTLMTLVLPSAVLIVAYGLFKKKLWAVYGIGALIIIKLAELGYNSSVAGVQITTGSLVVLGFYLLMFFWFVTSKKEFSR